MVNTDAINGIINSITQIPYLIVKYCYLAFKYVVEPIPDWIFYIIYIILLILSGLLVLWFIRNRNAWMRVKP